MNYVCGMICDLSSCFPPCATMIHKEHGCYYRSVWDEYSLLGYDAKASLTASFILEPEGPRLNNPKPFCKLVREYSLISTERYPGHAECINIHPQSFDSTISAIYPPQRMTPGLGNSLIWYCITARTSMGTATFERLGRFTIKGNLCPVRNHGLVRANVTGLSCEPRYP